MTRLICRYFSAVSLSLVLALAAGCGDRDVVVDQRRTPVVEAVERALPSVVNIGTERMVRTVYEDRLQQIRERLREQLASDFFGRPPPSDYQLAHSLGSGVVIHWDGYILTNYHVIERASTIYVTVGDLKNVEAELLAGDPISDLALLKVATDQPLDSIEFARDDDLLLGEPVVVLGNPYGLSQTVTVGVLSSKEREARHNGEVIFQDILQSDAAVNPGSSGGPLLNIRGELIGINIAVYKEAQNIGFAVPVKRVRQLLEHWLAPEFIYGKTLGIALKDTPAGLRVERVFEDGPAANAPISVGDHIRAVNDVPVVDLYAYRRELLGSALRGEDVFLELEKAFSRRNVALGWMKLPRPSGENLAKERLGLVLEPALDMEMQKPDRGLTISEVVPGSVAEELGVYSGLKLIAIDGRPVKNLAVVGEALNRVGAGDRVQLTLAEIKEHGVVKMVRQTRIELEVRGL